VPALLIKQLGIYPPGTLVKLANGEIAIVVRRGQTAKTPQTRGLQDRRGVKYSEPTHRDTSDEQFAIVDAVAEEGLVFNIDPARLFGYAQD
jgi:hypothetical protein